MQFGRLINIMIFLSLAQLVDSDNSTLFLWVSVHCLLPHRVSQPPRDDRLDDSAEWPVTLPLFWPSHTRTRGCGSLSAPLSGTRHVAQVWPMNARRPAHPLTSFFFFLPFLKTWRLDLQHPTSSHQEKTTRCQMLALTCWVPEPMAEFLWCLYSFTT